MPNFRRVHVPGGTYFFTLVTHQRRPVFADPAEIGRFGHLLRECRRSAPFSVEAIVVLPDHVHMIWRLPPDDIGYSRRIGWIKKEFTLDWRARSGADDFDTPASPWQPRFWEHVIRDDHDFERLVDYLHYNPVKHGQVTCPHQWRWSSFPRFVRRGIRPWDWACGCHGSVVVPTSIAGLGMELGE